MSNQLSLQQIKEIFPNANDDHITEFHNQHEELFDKYVSNVPFFLAQIGHESAGLTRFVENLNYSAKGLMRTWPSRFPNIVYANKFARNQEMIANNVYANRMGNGNSASGDGWKFRGHGPIQITGKDAYITVGNIIGLNLVDNPKLAIDPKYALLTVCGVWEWKQLNKYNNFITVTKRINGGTNGLRDRKHWLQKVNKVLSSTYVPRVTADQNYDIKEIQQQLNELRYKCGKPDGINGNRTKSAINRFKIDNELGNDYVITELVVDQLELLTDNKLIKKIQTELNQKNMRCGIVDGIFGKNTRNCILMFKQHNNITDVGIISDSFLESLGLDEENIDE